MGCGASAHPDGERKGKKSKLTLLDSKQITKHNDDEEGSQGRTVAMSDGETLFSVDMLYDSGKKARLRSPGHPAIEPTPGKLQERIALLVLRAGLDGDDRTAAGSMEDETNNTITSTKSRPDIHDQEDEEGGALKERPLPAAAPVPSSVEIRRKKRRNDNIQLFLSELDVAAPLRGTHLDSICCCSCTCSRRGEGEGSAAPPVAAAYSTQEPQCRECSCKSFIATLHVTLL
jgi:hypothetical protein